MKIPAKNTTADRMIHLLHARGPMTLPQMTAALPGVPRKSITAAATTYELCSEIRGTYELPESLRRHLDGCERQAVAATLPKALPRTVNIFGARALKNYEAAVRQRMRP